MSNPYSAYPRVHILIINWNNWQYTLDCLASLDALAYPNASVTVVDNASTNDSVARLRTARPDLHLMAETTNWGFAEGNNVGIRHALAQGAEYVWLLNNDTHVAPDCLTHLVETLQAHPDIGDVGPKIYFDQPSDRLWFAGAAYNPRLGKSRMVGYGERDDGARWEQNRDADFITGCALLVRADLLREIGLLDPAFFFIAEDLDFGLRVRAASRRNVVVSSAHIWHKVSASSGGEQSPLNLYYSTRNRLLLVKKHGRPGERLTFLAHFAASTVGKYLVFALLGRCSRASLGAVCLGIRDFARGCVGQAPPATQRRISPPRTKQVSPPTDKSTQKAVP